MESDWLQSAIIARAAELDLTAYAIAKATNGAVSEDHVRAYLTRAKSMGSHKLQHVIVALGPKYGWLSRAASQPRPLPAPIAPCAGA